MTLKQSESIKLIRKLAAGEVICHVSSSDYFSELKNKHGHDRECVISGLVALGLELKSSDESIEDSEYFYASHAKDVYLNPKINNETIKHMREYVKEVYKNDILLLGFSEIADRATREDSLFNVGHEIQLSKLQNELIRDDQGIKEIIQVIIKKMNRKSAASCDIHESIMIIRDQMIKLGYLNKNVSGLSLIVTGKMRHHLDILEKLEANRNDESASEDYGTMELGI
jgi:hypothetical protein